MIFVDFYSGAAIDLSSLVVVEGKICWDLYIDGLVVSSDGNLLDALGAAIKVVGCSYQFVNFLILFLLCESWLHYKLLSSVKYVKTGIKTNQFISQHYQRFQNFPIFIE